MQQLKKAIKGNKKLSPYYAKIYNLMRLIKRLVTAGAYMRWSYLVLEDKKVIYIVMRKVACTSIKASMLQMESKDDYDVVVQNIKQTGRLLGKLDPVKHKDFYKFTFVRNPFERLISCYENKFHTDYELRKGDGRQLMFDAYLLGYLQKDRGFSAFASRVCRIPDRIADHHIASQAFTIDGVGKGLEPDFVGHFEHLKEEYEPIRERFNFMPLPHHNKTPKAKNWMDYYDIETAKKVYKRYREDIERYGYGEVYEQLIEYLQTK